MRTQASYLCHRATEAPSAMKGASLIVDAGTDSTDTTSTCQSATHSVNVETDSTMWEECVTVTTESPASLKDSRELSVALPVAGTGSAT